MQNAIIFFFISFVIALVIAPFAIKVLKRLKAGQNILHYVDFHAKKSGTPTMGGFIFILPLLALSVFILNRDTPLCNIIVLASVGYALIGFLDDFIKIRGKQNLGLRAYQKIIGQGGIAILVSIFYYTVNPEGRVFIPFFNTFFDLGFWIAPLCFIAIIAIVNSVNLTDGLDGLAGSVSFFYLLFLCVIVTLVGALAVIPESQTIIQIAAVTMGALMCFLLFNTNKAKVFMGDTGSLYLGSIIGLLSIFSFLGVYLIILGVMFVVSSLSDILQVAYFKLTKKKNGDGKRIFLMAPFHHHLEKRGWAEAKIVFLYSTITILVGMACVVTLI